MIIFLILILILIIILSHQLFTEFAFGTHAAAYWDAGLRELPFSDVKIVGATPDFSDMVCVYAWRVCFCY